MIDHALSFAVAWLAILPAVGLLGAGVVAWFRAPAFGHYAGLILICIGAGMLAHQRGVAVARQECEAAAIQSQLEAAREALAIAEDKAREGQQRAALIEAASRASSEKINDLERELAARDAAPAPVPATDSPAPAAPSCPAPVRSDRATESDVRRLRSLRQ